MDAPAFWYEPALTWQSRVLAPLAWVYCAVSARVLARRAARPVVMGVPLVSVGNLTVGGSGKTPLTMLIAAHFSRKGYRVAVVACGSGGRVVVPTRVTAAHTAAEVGDEAKLLAKRLPDCAVWSGSSKPATVQAAEAAGATLVVLDDGFQRLDIPRTVNVLAVGGGGFGNGRVVPAGPLREPPVAACRADVVVAMADMPPVLPDVPTFCLAPALCADTVKRLEGKPLVAFAAIARPQRFFDALRAAGLQVVAEHGFGDHHRFGKADLQMLRADAARQGATLACTEKDAVKLPDGFGAIAVPLVVGGADVNELLACLEARVAVSGRCCDHRC
ncbi:MAG: tetraacyldisaccharide 4'-kinase [Pseudomonadaceae bacterium]|nr:tetraacyldisaccharide 4'-kinase [Pseudomonadaceae bacterium]